MRLSTLLLACSLSFAASPSDEAVFAPLWSYSGTWRVAKDGAKAGEKPDTLTNLCALVGTYYVCQQKVNDSVSALLTFVSSRTAGQFFTQSIRPDGRAGGRGELLVEGNKWTFSSSWNQGAKTTYYRTINVFSGKTSIHYEQQESTDRKDWKTTATGTETRTAPGKNVTIR